MEIDIPEPTETDMLKNKEGLPEVRHVHYDNSIKSKIHGFMLYFCKFGDIVKCCESVFFTIYAICAVVMALGMLVATTFGIFTFIGWLYITCFPHNKSYSHSKVEFFANNTKYEINPQYDSCYVSNDVKHCHLYKEQLLFDVGFFIFIPYSIAIFTTFAGAVDVLNKGYVTMSVICAILSATVMGTFIYLVKTNMFSDIEFYGNSPPPAFKNITTDCEKLSAVEIECKYHNEMDSNMTIMFFSLFGMLFISLFISVVCNYLCEKWDEYMQFRETVKKSVQEEAVNLV